MFHSSDVKDYFIKKIDDYFRVDVIGRVDIIGH